MSIENKLSALHDMLCDELIERLKNGEDDGPAKASTLNVIRQFLKDNNVDALPVEGSVFGDLLAELPEEFRVAKSKH